MKRLPNIELKTALLKKGLTQRELAFETGIDEARVSRFVKGWEQPTEEIRKAISQFLGLSVSEVFPGQGSFSN